ncbi:MAG: hypothetical protein KAQ63_00480 [Candidatus Moranbacteria bacterium]|nr:hypothetical protein [Candidatus Moranbacteria bacterium]
MTKSIPKNTKCVDCKESIKVGDSNISYWKKEKAYRCEKCTNKLVGTEVYSRVVGYIRPVQQWNVGKTEEFCDRVTFKV